MDQPLQCCIHVGGDTEERVTKLTEKAYAKLCQCAEDWAKFDCEESVLALQIVSTDEPDNNTCFAVERGFHRSCYQRFTDKRRIATAEKRVNKRKIVESAQDDLKRVCRSATTCSYILPESHSVNRLFKPKCLICRKTKNITCTQSSVRTQEKLVKCQTFSAASTLKHCATTKKDTELLFLIEGEDLIAKEAMYHKSCYRNYTYSYTKVGKIDDDNYAQFCKEVIEGRILEGGEILSMNKLTELYLHICSCNNEVDRRTVRNKDLKRKLRQSHPNLMFLRVSNVSWSELVMQKQPIGTLTLDIDDGSDDSVDEEDGPGDHLQYFDSRCNMELEEIDGKRKLFHSASMLKEVVKAAPKIPCAWPPTAPDLSMEAVSEVIPNELFNFLAHVVGYNTELPEGKEFLDVAEDQRKKLFSVCQDIIYLATKGLNPMPKHLALGLTVRHLTGSTKLIGILNGLGHCVSPTSVADYDAAIALLNGRDEDAVPPGITEKFTTFVFDNNDFGEETLTGKGTTHCTNGIVIQRCQAQEGGKETGRMRQPVPKTRGQRPVACERQFEKMSLAKRQGPSNTFPKIQLESTAQDALVKNKNIEAGYVISKLPTAATQCLPSWSGFNTLLYKEIPNKSVIGYLPVIAGSPTRLEIVNEVLRKCISMADRLKQQTVVLVVDQAIYCKAQQIRWLDAYLQERIVIRMGEFHTCMAFLATIGKRFRDGGLQDILIDSNLVAEGSLNGVFSGHHYNRSVRVMKVLYEAFYRLLVDALLSSLTPEKNKELLDRARNIREAFKRGTFFEAVQMDDFQELVLELKEFSSMRSCESPTFQYWMTFIQMVETLLSFIRATRTGDWNLHLASVRQMLPWFFAYDRVNYARYLTVYWLEMLNLGKTHLAVQEEFLDGNFVVQQQTNLSFSQTAMDQTIEQTLNRDSKTKGGIKSMTLKKNAVHCWILSFAERAKIQECCEQMAGRKQNSRGRKELDQTRIKQDEESVESVVDTMNVMTNPFTTQDEELLNVASGKVAPCDVRMDLERAESLGESELQKYIDQRMQKKEMDMFSPIRAQKLKTFSATGKEKRNGEVATLKASSQLLTRMLFLAKIKNLDMTHILSFSLTPIPPSLGNYDGGLARTNKAKLLQHLVVPEDLLPATTPGAIQIIDGMAYIQQLTCIPPTFGELAILILRGLLAIAAKHHSKRIDFVTDQYWQLSIKNSERDRRGDGQGAVTRIQHQAQKTPSNFKRFLSCGKNKEALVGFLYRHWEKYDSDSYSGVTVYLAHGVECHAFSSNGVNKVDALSADHEEADTRVMLHACHALHECEHVVINSPDTDVFLLAVALNQELEGKIELRMGTASSQKNICISSVSERIPNSIQTALPGFHAFTGCDTTSAFKGKGKIKAYKLMSESPLYHQAFSAIGNCWTSDNLPWEDLERFLCELYGQVSESTLTKARANIFKCSFKADVSLPPTHDEFVQHVRRANYQAAILKRALEQEIKAPTPCDHGWHLEEGQLAVRWSTKELAPDILLKEVFCKCKKTGCSSAKCSCKTHGLKCTELCQCNQCTNFETDDMRVEDGIRIEDEDDQGD